jgi:hypothetical protein
VTTALINPRSRVLFVCAVVLALLIPIHPGQAQSVQTGINFTISVEPTSLTAPGTVTVSTRIANAGSEDMNSPISLYDPDGKLVTAFADGGSLPRLPAGESHTWQGQYAVKQSQLDEGKLVYTLRYNTKDALGAVVEQNLPATATITFTGERVDLQVNRTITPEVVRRGKEVTIIYDLVNQGNVKLTNIDIQENRLISTRKQSVASLEPGASAKITFTKQNVGGDLSSSALITYRKAGDRKSQAPLTIDAVSIPLAKPGLQYSLTSDKNQYNIGETAVLTLEIKNAGNITYSNITVTDPKLGEVFTNVQIAAGQTKQLQKEVTVNETTTYAFTLKLEDNTGSTMEEKVRELKVSAYAEGQMLRLNLTLTASSEVITAMPGDITFYLNVTNDSNTAAKNIVIRHADMEIYTIKELAPGQSTMIQRDYSLSQAGKYQFSATATDVQDNKVEFLSNALNISYTAPTAAPTKEIIVTIAPAITYTPVPEDYAPAGGQTKVILFILTLALGVLFGLSAILLVVSIAMRAKARAKSNAAYDTFELAGTRDYTAPADETKLAIQAAPDVEQESAAQEAGEPQEELPHQKYLKSQQSTEDVQESTGEPLAADEEGAFRLLRTQEADSLPGDEETTATSREEDVTERRSNRRTQRHKPENASGEK